MAFAALKKSKTPDNQPRVASLEEASPEYAALKQKRAALHVELRSLGEERNEVSIRLHAARNVRPISESEARVLKIVDGEAPTPLTNDRQRLTEIDRRVADLESAIKIMDDRVSQARYRASAIVCDEVAAEYKTLVAGMCEKLTEAFGAVKSYAQLIDELERQDVAWSALRPMMPIFLFGRSGADSQAPGAQFMREAASYGFIDRSQIPGELR